MLLGNDLRGRSVVDVDSAEKLGQVEDLIVDPKQGQLAGLVVSHGPSLLGGGVSVVVPATAIKAIGPDLLTVRRAETAASVAALDPLPRWSRLTGRKVVSQGGKVLGTIEDVVFDPESHRVGGYPLRTSGAGGGLDVLLSGQHRRAPYLRPDTDLRVGDDLVVVPDDAVVQDDSAAAHDPRSDRPPDVGSSLVDHPLMEQEDVRARADHNLREAQDLLSADPHHQRSAGARPMPAPDAPLEKHRQVDPARRDTTERS
jgi:sporulation protein YlmC with PRC-barrel domain